MFDYLSLCVAVGLLISVYFILKPRPEQNKATHEEAQTEAQQEKEKIPEEEKKSRMIEIGGFIMVTYIISSLFASQIIGDGFSYKIGYWLGNIATIAVITGVIVGIIYIIKGRLSFRSVMNIIWIVAGMNFFILSFAY